MIHEYFKREFDDFIILVQLNPESYAGVELTIYKNGKTDKRQLQFDAEIYDDLKEDNFSPSSPLEFNLYLKGIKT